MKLKTISQAILMIGAVGLTGQVVAADAVKAKVEKIEVTGSNIKRASREAASPVQVVTRAEIAATGAASVQELMRLLPSVGSGGYMDAADQNGFSKGVATVSLRGMGSTATLVLLNGRRMTPSAFANPNNGQSTLYNLNNIPVSAIERVEVLRDGASAVYGSDAIAGVVNFITRKDYQGAELTGSYGANDDHQFVRKTANFAAGFGNLASQGFNILVAGDLNIRDRVGIKDAVNDIPQDAHSDVNARLIPYWSALSNSPIFFAERNVGGVAQSGLFNSTNAVRNGAPVPVITLNCSANQQLVGTTAFNLAASNYLVGRTFCNYDGNVASESASKGRDATLMTRGTFELSANLKGFAELAFVDSQRDYTTTPRAMIGTSPTTNFSLQGAASTFQAILPVGHPDNPFTSINRRAALGYRFENAQAGTEQNTRDYRALFGLEGESFGWDWSGALLWNRNNRTTTNLGQLHVPTLRKLVNENMSIGNLITQPGLYRNTTNEAYADIIQGDVRVGRELFNLPGGAAAVALGGEVRQERMVINADPLTATGQILGLANTNLDSKRMVSSAFAEFRLPLLNSLEAEIAGRYDKYEKLKGNFVPKFGVKWLPAKNLALRTTYAHGFRAPGINQIAAGGAQYFLNSFTDPLRCPDGVNPVPGADPLDCSKSISGVGEANPNLTPEKSRSLTAGLIWDISKNTSVELGYFKIRNKGEIALMSGEYVAEHESENPSLVTRDTNPATFLVDAAGNPRPGTGPLLSVKTPWINQGSTEVQGIDFDFRARGQLMNGKLSARLSGVYNLKYLREEQPGMLRHNAVGSRGGLNDWATSVGEVPRVKLNYSLTWEKAAHLMGASVNYVSSVSLMRRHDNDVTYAEPYCYYGTGQPKTAYALGGKPKYSNWSQDCKISAWTTVGVNYNYKGVKDLDLGLNIQNLFDRKAPFDPNATALGYNSALHDGRGRYFSVSAKYKFR